MRQDRCGLEKATEEVGAVVQVVNHGGLHTGAKEMKRSRQIKNRLAHSLYDLLTDWMGG